MPVFSDTDDFGACDTEPWGFLKIAVLDDIFHKGPPPVICENSYLHSTKYNEKIKTTYRYPMFRRTTAKLELKAGVPHA